MGRFDARVAVVTGAARGIGFGTAKRFAEEGAAVAVLDLDESAAAKRSWPGSTACSHGCRAAPTTGCCGSSPPARSPRRVAAPAGQRPPAASARPR